MEDIINVVEICEEKLDATAMFFVNNEKKPEKNIINYLMNINSNKDLQGLPISPDVALKIMRLYIYGAAYLSINYDCSIGQAPEDCVEILNFLENLNYKDILNIPIDEGIVEEYIKFKIQSNYILHQKAKENILDSQLLFEYFKIYPFGIFTMNSILQPLNSTENMLIDIINMYNYVFNLFEKPSNVSDEDFWLEFNKIVAKNYSDTDHIYRYIIANVYKNIFVSNILVDNLKESTIILINYIEQTPIEIILYEIKENAELAMQILDTFYNYNCTLSKGMKEEIDIYFQRNNDGEILKRINPNWLL